MTTNNTLKRKLDGSVKDNEYDERSKKDNENDEHSKKDNENDEHSKKDNENDEHSKKDNENDEHSKKDNQNDEHSKKDNENDEHSKKDNENDEHSKKDNKNDEHSKKDNDNDEHSKNSTNLISSDDFWILWSMSTAVKSVLTDQDRAILLKLSESIKTFDLDYHGTINVYQHNEHGYVFTTDKRDHDGVLTWFLASGEKLRISPIHFWAKPTKQNVDDEKKWLQNVTLIGSFEYKTF
jgi:hypothetical protein